MRGLGAYVRALPRSDLPSALRRYQGLRQSAVSARRAAILAAFEDENVRAQVLEWLDDAKPSLKGNDAAILRTATARPDGWEEALPAYSTGAPAPRPEPRAREPDLERALGREREKVRKARADLRRARAGFESELEDESARAASFERRAGELESRLASTEDALEDAHRAAAHAEDLRRRDERRSRRAVERAHAERDEARGALKDARRAGAELERAHRELKDRVARLEAEIEARRDAVAPPVPRPPKRRRLLRAPTGRLETDPQTLEAWLGAQGVVLLVDGYNVTRAEGGFGGLELENQRDRLVRDVSTLAARVKVRTIVVFDGSEVPGPSRRFQAAVEVEYSRPDQTADDRLVEVVEGIRPEVPVVVATSDRPLQDRVRAHGATVATSGQLLALIR